MNAKRKGCAGEREFAALLREHGYTDAHRCQQFTGGIDTPDVTGMPGYHLEIKRVEKLNIHEAYAQAERDANGKAVPVVCHRRNRGQWMVTMRAVDWLGLLHADTV